MDRADAPLRLNAGDSPRQTDIETIAARMIAERGYHWVINNLLATIYALAERSLTDPWNFSKQLDFTLWVSAVRSVVQRHGEQRTFEHRVTDGDRASAREMGIKLD